MRERIAGLALGVLVAVGCGSSSEQTGELGKAVFNASNCGEVVSSLQGCDLKKLIAVGGLVDVHVVRAAGNAPLQLRSDMPDILKVDAIANSGYTLSGQSNGKAVLTAFDTSGDVDRLTVNVNGISLIAYNTLSNGSGTFMLQPGGDIDGFFTLAPGVNNFTLLYLQVDEKNESMLGRDSFSYELSTGLVFQNGADMPHGLRFDLLKPATAGMYTLLVRAKYGAGRFKMQINVN